MSKRPWQLEWVALRFPLRFVLYPGSFLRQADAFPLFPGTISISPLSRRLLKTSVIEFSEVIPVSDLPIAFVISWWLLR